MNVPVYIENLLNRLRYAGYKVGPSCRFEIYRNKFSRLYLNAIRTRKYKGLTPLLSKSCVRKTGVPPSKTVHMEAFSMYQQTEGQIIFPGDFFLPFGGKLAEDNRWVLLPQIVPWWKVEENYAKNFIRSLKGFREN